MREWRGNNGRETIRSSLRKSRANNSSCRSSLLEVGHILGIELYSRQRKDRNTI